MDVTKDRSLAACQGLPSGTVSNDKIVREASLALDPGAASDRAVWDEPYG